MSAAPGPLDERTAGPLTAWSVGDQVLVADKWSDGLKPALVMAENPARPNVVKVKYLESRTAAWVDRARVRRRRHGQQPAAPAPAAAVVEPDDQVADVEAIRRAVACPYCHAAAGEHCRTMNGTLTGRFGTRVNHYRRTVAYRRLLTAAAAPAVVEPDDQVAALPAERGVDVLPLPEHTPPATSAPRRPPRQASDAAQPQPGSTNAAAAAGVPVTAASVRGLPAARPAGADVEALALLDERARHYAADAVPDSTRRAYQSDVRQFVAWCELHGLQALPATPATLCRYLAALADQGAKLSTIRRKLSALAQAHRAAGVEPPPTQDHSVRQLVRALRRSLGVAPAQKSPLVVDELRRVVHALPDTLAGRRDRALLLVGLAGAFRRSELADLDIADVEYDRAGLVIRLRRSKTDQEGAGRAVAIPYGSHPDTCPVRALEDWELAREEARQQGDTCRALFRGVNRHDQLRPGRLSGHAVAELVKRRAAGAGLDAAAYSGHSLRAGHVTSADEGGAPESATMRQTGHRSAATLRGYIRHGSLFRQNSAAYLGL